MIVVIGRVSCEADKRDALVAHLERMQEASRAEEGCIRYGFFAAVEDPLSFVAVEEWADRAALDRHFEQPHLTEFAAGLGELVSGAPEVAIHEIAGSSGFSG
ncbi:putative quinol monooxygenase [soil metagenome]